MGRIYLENGQVNPLYAQTPAPTQTPAEAPSVSSQPAVTPGPINTFIRDILSKASNLSTGSAQGAISSGLHAALPITQLPGMFPEVAKSVQQTGQGLQQNIQDLLGGNIGAIQQRNEFHGITPGNIATASIIPQSIVAQGNQTAKSGKEIGKNFLETIVLNKVLSDISGLFKGLSGQSGKQISQIAKSTQADPVTQDQVFRRIQYEAPSGVKPQDSPNAYKDVRDAINSVKVDMDINGKTLTQALQDWKNTLNYTDQAKAYGAKLDNSLKTILSREIKTLAPDIAKPYQEFGQAAKVKGVVSTASKRIPYLLERAIVNAPLYYLLNRAFKQLNKIGNP